VRYYNVRRAELQRELEVDLDALVETSNSARDYTDCGYGIGDFDTIDKMTRSGISVASFVSEMGLTCETFKALRPSSSVLQGPGWSYINVKSAFGLTDRDMHAMGIGLVFEAPRVYNKN
jgi:hypothetical protein